MRDPVGEIVQLSKGHLEIFTGKHNGRGIRLDVRQPGKVGGDVDEFLRSHIVLSWRLQGGENSIEYTHPLRPMQAPVTKKAALWPPS